MLPEPGLTLDRLSEIQLIPRQIANVPCREWSGQRVAPTRVDLGRRGDRANSDDPRYRAEGTARCPWRLMAMRCSLFNTLHR
ncbi:hypothetical protein LshimejAT787_0604090 [Lyophyllum shimeji]|uniref:Uncharacterized protein n=1 Tax=Lyophyllum shimeji TaxID=47721 RepID=A0A9P3PMT7_LYOSH|nr:hypothetical protein LshimejAT787_0604090 [Lyophyllum shimeji]